MLLELSWKIIHVHASVKNCHRTLSEINTYMCMLSICWQIVLLLKYKNTTNYIVTWLLLFTKAYKNTQAGKSWPWCITRLYMLTNPYTYNILDRTRYWIQACQLWHRILNMVFWLDTCNTHTGRDILVD